MTARAAPGRTEPENRPPAIEWPTIALLLVIYSAWLGLTWFHAAIPLWIWLPLAAWTSAWWGSAQHELLHGHPTRRRALNTALATPPFWLWLPFECYRHSHLKHHCDERLTDPLDDPESRYLRPEDWRALGPIGRWLVLAQNTLLGRLIIGPFWSLAVFWREEAQKLGRAERDSVRIWGQHLVWVALILVWVVGVCRMPVWHYLAGFVYCGTALAMVRSFAEHRARDDVAQRTAIVEQSPLFGLLFLNNNLHVVHHEWPSLPWYKLPRIYAQNRGAILARNGGLVYAGYRDLFRRYFLKRHDAPVHPTGRAPFSDGVMPAAGIEPVRPAGEPAAVPERAMAPS